MAALDQITTGGVTYDINDKRISSTAVTTATHILTCNSGVSSIAPITAANLAAVLGVTRAMFGDGAEKIPENADLNNYTTPGAYRAPNSTTAQSISHRPGGTAFQLWYISPFNVASDRAKYGVQIAFGHLIGIMYRIQSSEGSWNSWTSI